MMGFRLKRRVVNRLELIARAATSTETKNAVASHVRKGMISRTTKDEVDAGGAPFRGYSTEPITIMKNHRPAPSKGGRTKALRGGRTLKHPRYDGGYAAFKAAVIGGGVNLYGTFAMLAALTWRLTAKGAVLYFMTALQNAKAYAHINGDGVPKRDFMGWGNVAGETESTVALIREKVNAQAGIK